MIYNKLWNFTQNKKTTWNILYDKGIWPQLISGGILSELCFGCEDNMEEWEKGETLDGSKTKRSEEGISCWEYSKALDIQAPIYFLYYQNTYY